MPDSPDSKTTFTADPASYTWTRVWRGSGPGFPPDATHVFSPTTNGPIPISGRNLCLFCNSPLLPSGVCPNSSPR